MNGIKEQTHIISYWTFAAVLAALLILTVLTVKISMIDIGKLNVWIALLIAVSKSSLVILFFMHMKFEKMAVRVAFIATLCFAAVLIGFVFWDIVYRS